MNILIIGGTRNMGHFLALELLLAGHKVTILNRGISRDELPEDIERLHADRTDEAQFRAALAGREFDAVVDMVLHQGHEAETTVEVFAGRTGHYLMMSTGQVYLVREGLTRPFKESDYDGPLIPMPEANTYDYEEYTYGVQKRAAEDVLAAAAREKQFPFTVLRLPMVNSERDHFHRLYSYILRIKDGGPILVPDVPNHPLRHIYGRDVVRVLCNLLDAGTAHNRAFNLSQEETIALDDFLMMLGQIIGKQPEIITVERERLQADGFLPDCSPFSDRWMSELDNTLSKTELGVTYTPLRDYLPRLVNHYLTNPPPQPVGYRRRRAEKQLVQYG